MNILFVHNNFPAQFQHVARALAGLKNMHVAAIGSATARSVGGVRLLRYSVADGDVSASHPFARRFDLECRRAEEVLYAASSLVASGFVPDVVVAHTGWGESLPLRAIFPKARLIAYCEFFYGSEGRDVGFDPEFPQPGIDGRVALAMKNAASVLTLCDADAAVSATAWQRSTFPLALQSKIAVIHEGVDTDLVKPDPDAAFRLDDGTVLTASDEVVTYAARDLEPLRGYHIFMRAVPLILDARPQARIVVMGRDGTSYGMAPPPGRSWRAMFFDEVADRVDVQRVHFTGQLSHKSYLRALQVSSAHVYLTYPFVVSWSLIEALGAGCLVVASDTAPVRDIITPESGMLVPFFDVDRLASTVVEALARPGASRSHRANARQLVLEKFDTRRICVPAWLQLLLGSS